MNAHSSVSALTSALVHQSALSSPALCQRHAAFIVKRLAITSSVLAVAPFFLAFRGAPTGAETLVFACSFAPLAAAVLALRTGWLTAAHGVAFLGLVALSVCLWAGLGCGAGCAIAWLITAQLEAMLAGDKRLALSAGVVTGSALIAIFAATLHGAPAAHSPGTAIPEVFAGLALAYAIVAAAGSSDAATPARPPKYDDARTWRSVAEMLDDLVVELSATGSVLRVPGTRERRLGVTVRHLIGRGMFEHIHVADRPTFLQGIAHADGGETAIMTIRLRMSQALGAIPAPPVYRWVELRARQLAPGDGVVAVLRDVDAVHEQETSNAARTSTGEGTSRDHFLAGMSHELRTPLNAIIGFSEMLASHTLRPVQADKQREYARIIHQSGQHLLSVVNAILDMSKIRSGALEIVPESFDVVPLVDQCCDMVALKAEEGRVRLVRDCPERLDAIIGDKRAYKQILINLLSNAVKFTPEQGTVTIAVRLQGDVLVMSVSDTGVGIGEADLARLGDPFFQARSTSSRFFEGTGLGLSVVRGLVGLQGGTITIESELGHGTHVKVQLPRDCRATHQRSTSATIEPIARRQIAEPMRNRTEQRMKYIA